MSTIPAVKKETIEYPDSDRQPIADNTLQFKWIVTIKENLEVLFARDPNVFVAGDLLWYPVEGQPKICQAPDTMVAFGRPKGYRGSYKQWMEGGIAPQVVFEVLSPNNRVNELNRKFQFYEHHGVEEYYIFDPDDIELFGWLRDGDLLQEIADMENWRSPRLGIRFSLASGDLVITRPDGKPFLTFEELAEERDREAQRAEEQSRRAEEQSRRAQEQSRRAEEQTRRAEEQERRAQDEAKRAEQAEQQRRQVEVENERLRARLRALGEETS